MALTALQRSVCRLTARRRIDSGESYVAGGTALISVTKAPRISQDIDVFHDTAEAVAVSWQADREIIESSGYVVDARRERDGFVEAMVTHGGERVLIQWTRDSAFRFFPLVEHADF